MRPKDIGTRGESAVVKYLRANGFGGAERRALTGSLDQGDITGCGPLVIEVKAGAQADNPSDGQVAAWMAETEVERRNARADIGVLVLRRKGKGNAGDWWAYVYADVLARLIGSCDVAVYNIPVRLRVADAVWLLRNAGYGDPIQRQDIAS